MKETTTENKQPTVINLKQLKNKLQVKKDEELANHPLYSAFANW